MNNEAEELQTRIQELDTQLKAAKKELADLPKTDLPNKRKVKYKITDGFGDAEVGDIRDSYVLFANGQDVLTYHPAIGKYESGSLEFIKRNASGDYYVSSKKGVWVNLDKSEAKLIEQLLKQLTPKCKGL